MRVAVTGEDCNDVLDVMTHEYIVMATIVIGGPFAREKRRGAGVCGPV